MRDADLLREILYRADSGLGGAELFTADEMRQWPQASLIPFLESGLLIPAQPSPTVMCDGCAEGHWEEPELLKWGPDAEARAYITCPEAGRVPVNLERLRRWRLDILKLGEMVAACLSIRQTPREVVRSRLWSLGKTNLAGRVRDMFLARGLAWPDAKGAIGVRPRPDEYGSRVLLALSEAPARDVMEGPATCSLARLVTFIGGQLDLDQAALETALSIHASDAAGAGYVFRKEGDYWTVRFDGTSFLLKDSKGLSYLAHLLRYPGRAFHVLDLVSVVEGRETVHQTRSDRDLRISSLGDAGPTLDASALAEYRQRVASLDKELQDGERLSEAELDEKKSEKAFIDRELARAAGLGGRARRAGSATEKARSNVSKLIARAIDRSEMHEAAALAQFLRNTITTGTYCTYTPDRPIDWTF